MSRTPFSWPLDGHGPARPARRALLAALAAAPLAACNTTTGGIAPGGIPGASPAAPPPAPRARVGDRWRYAEFNGFNHEQRSEVTFEVVSGSGGAPLVLSAADTRRGPRLQEVFVAPWTAQTEATFDFAQSYEQPMPLLPDSLVPGATSRLRTWYRVPDSSLRFDWTQWIDARGWERVRVPAGEFDALRVERRIWFTHVDPMRIQSSRVDVLWYAPSIDRWVRREWTGWYRWPGRRGGMMRDDWVIHELIERVPTPRAG